MLVEPVAGLTVIPVADYAGLRPATEEAPPFQVVRNGPRWRNLPADNYVRRQVESGHRLPFKRRCPKIPFHEPVPRRLETEHVGARIAEAKRLLTSGALVQAPHQTSTSLLAAGHQISPAFMVDKQGSTKKRTVYNMKRLNRQFRKKKGKLDDLRMLKSLAQKGWVACSMDVGAAPRGKDGYHAIEIHPRDQKYMTIDLGEAVEVRSRGPPDRQALLDQVGEDITGMSAAAVRSLWSPVPRYVMCSGLPFGYTNAPWLFQKTMRTIAADLRRGGSVTLPDGSLAPPIVCLVYLDDWLILAPSVAEMERIQPVVDQVLAEYGICRQAGKGVWPPGGTQVLEHLGIGANLGLGIFFVPERRMKRIRQQAKALLSSRAKHCSTVDSLWLAQFAGLAISTWLAVPQARYRVRPMFDDLVRGGAYRKRFRGSVRLSRETVRMIMWWRDLVSNPAVGRTVWRPLVDTTICTDASTSIGWGGTFGGRPLTGDPQQNVGLPAAGIWTPAEQADIKAGRQNITGLELIAVRRCLEQWRRLGLLSQRSMLLYEDNAGVVGILKNFCARSPAMREDLFAIMQILEMEDAMESVVVPLTKI